MIQGTGRMVTYWELRARISQTPMWQSMYRWIRNAPYITLALCFLGLAMGERGESIVTPALVGLCALLVTAALNPSGYLARRFPVPCDPEMARDYLLAEHENWVKHVKLENITRAGLQKRLSDAAHLDRDITAPLISGVDDLDRLYTRWCETYKKAVLLELYPLFAQIEAQIRSGASMEQVAARVSVYEARRKHFELVREEFDVFVKKINDPRSNYLTRLAALEKLNTLLLLQVIG